MQSKFVEVLFAPTDYEALTPASLTDAVCVVFDVLRATSSMVTALYHGAHSIRPASSVPDALQLKVLQPDCLLAGERNGIRIRSDATGGIDFDLGNSPREFTPSVVEGKSIIMTTTNGTRALQACRGASTTAICSFLNLRATSEYLLGLEKQSLLLICSGTDQQVAYEDVLCAGALLGLISAEHPLTPLADSALMAHRLYQGEAQNIESGLARSVNGRRLMALPELREDVAFCAQRDRFYLVAGMTGDAPITVIHRQAMPSFDSG
jgi:2-phosphosulfolactate phosphatase